jgi:arginine-tRNA-protein transferase
LTQHSRDTPQFYLTAPSPCPYLPGRQERKVFTHLVGDKATDLNDLLTHGGFRRSQSIAYRPACDQCRACVSVRVIANEFRPSRNFRKVLARNADIVGEQRSAVPTSEQYSIFRGYLDQRHRHGGMADMTVLDYAMMVEDSHVETRVIEYRRRNAISGSRAPRRWTTRAAICRSSAWPPPAGSASMPRATWRPSRRIDERRMGSSE